jgi:pimeloyl-ACP methyl ester carboxylesterase
VSQRFKNFLSISIIVFILVPGCAGTKPGTTTAKRDNGYTVVIIGGARSTPEQMEVLRSSFPESVVIVPSKYYPLWLGADAVLKQIKDKGGKGKLVLIGHSWGGLLAREIDGEHPGLVKAVVTIATPCGNFRYTPDGFSDVAFRPQDRNSTTPLYIIGGYGKVGTKWWMKTSESDGVVDISSVMATGGRSIKGSAIVEGEHSELLQDVNVIGQIKTWLAQADELSITAPAEITANAPILSNRKVALLRWSFMTGMFHIALIDLAKGTLDNDIDEICEWCK